MKNKITAIALAFMFVCTLTSCQNASEDIVKAASPNPDAIEELRSNESISKQTPIDLEDVEETSDVSNEEITNAEEERVNLQGEGAITVTLHDLLLHDELYMPGSSKKGFPAMVDPNASAIVQAYQSNPYTFVWRNYAISDESLNKGEQYKISLKISEDLPLPSFDTEDIEYLNQLNLEDLLLVLHEYIDVVEVKETEEAGMGAAQKFQLSEGDSKGKVIETLFDARKIEKAFDAEILAIYPSQETEEPMYYDLLLKYEDNDNRSPDNRPMLFRADASEKTM